MIFTDLYLPAGDGWEKGELRVEDGMFSDSGEGEKISLGGAKVLPGLIDTHIHGAFGEAFDHADADLHRAAKMLARAGVTAFAPTLSALGERDALAAIRNIVAASRAQGADEARILGIHLEGPFVSPKRAGALNPENLRLPDVRLFRELVGAGEGLVKLMTVAPELEGAPELAAEAARLGVKLSMGHSTAAYEQAEAAVNAGFHRATHVFNGMVPFAHREPGLLGAALTDPRIECEMICDLVHLSAPAVKLVLLAKGAARVTAISDAVSGAGLGDGEHELGGVKYRIADGVARLENGTICGSCRTLDAALMNLISLGVAPADAVRICSTNPARALGAEKVGSLSVGMRADFVTVDEAGAVESVYLVGERVR